MAEPVESGDDKRYTNVYTNATILSLGRSVKWIDFRGMHQYTYTAILSRNR